MADKEKISLQKHEKSILTMESKLGAMEELQTEAKEQMAQLKMDIAVVRQGNFEVNHRLNELTDLLKKEILGRQTPVVGASTQHTTAMANVTQVCSVPQTPTNVATINSPLNVSGISSSGSVNWGGPRTVLATSTVPPFPAISTHVPIISMDFTAPPVTQGFQQSTPMSPLNHQLLPYQHHFIPSTLNPYALPIYPHFTQNSVSTPHTTPSTQPNITYIPQNFIPQMTPPQPWTPSTLPNTYKTPKLDFPKFDGKDPRGWINKCEKFFQLNPSTDLRSRVLCAAIHMASDADIWYRTIEREKTNLLWPEFCHLVCQRFSKSGYENVVGQFNKLTQKGKVEEYITQFDELRNYVMAEEGFHRESYYIDNFISGLKEDIAQYLYNQKPTTMQEARDMARGQEYFLSVLDKRYKSSYPGQKSNYNKSPSTGGPGSSQVTPPPATEGFKKLTVAELTEKRQKGLCYHCDQKYEPGHDCRKKKLYVMIADEQTHDGPTEEELAIIWEGNNGDTLPETTKQLAKVSINAMNGSPGTGTIKLQGHLHGRPITILVDSGSTHDFISTSLVKQLQLKTKPTTSINVTIADGSNVKCDTVVEPLFWKMSGEEFSSNTYVLPLGGYDLILGVHWMATVSPVTFDYSLGYIKVNHKGRQIKLQQNISPSSVQLELQHSTKPFHKEEAYFLIQVTAVEENCKLTNPLPANIESLVQEYKDIFAAPSNLPPPRRHDHYIPLKPGSTPVSSNPYRCPIAHKEEIEKITKEMLEAGVIKASTSPFASPVLLVRKKDNSWRLVVDYRALNAITIKNKFPIPIIEELLAELKGSRVYSKLDLRSGYHQIRVSGADTYKTAFKTHQGLFEFLVMPFGLTNAPASFQALMNDVFAEYLRKFVLVFFDDILIYSTCIEEHERHLRLVFEKLRAHELFLKHSKCDFAKSEVEYLGHIINNSGVAADPTKISAMLNWPQPKTIRGLRGFLGLTGYYRRFVRDYGIITRPLTNLLKKGNFLWSKEATAAFQKLKEVMTNTPVLALPDFSKPLVVETDACKGGVGAVLMQDSRPIAFLSKALSPKHLGLSTYEKELLAVIIATQKWRSYLLGHPFIIKTDHESLKHLMEQRITTSLQQRWLSKLMGFDYMVQYRKGKENHAADALSRLHEEAELSVIVHSQKLKWKEELEESLVGDEAATRLITQLSIDPANNEGYTFVNGELKRFGRFYVGNSTDLRTRICVTLHDSIEGGHSGVAASLKRVERLFYWPSLKTDITNHVKECDICQRNKPERLKPAGLLQPIAIPEDAWQVISMDFVEGLPKSKGTDVILVVVDKLTKYCHLIPLCHPFSAAKVAQSIIDNVVKLHGLPLSIISDRDSVFMSSFWKELFNAMGTKLKMSTAYHPQTDGQTERVNQCIEMFLRCVAGHKPNLWANWLSLAEWWYNTTHHTAIGMSPFQALYSTPPPSINYHYSKTNDPAVNEYLHDRFATQQLLKDNLVKAQERMKWYYDKKRTEREFAVGDEVYLKLQPYRQQSLQERKNHKLSAKYYGPYTVTKRIGTVAYQLALPVSSKIHNVFHVSQLKKKLGTKKVVQTSLPTVEDTGIINPQPLQILDRRLVKKGNKPATKVLIQWENGTAEEATWEWWEQIAAKFPEFHP